VYKGTPPASEAMTAADVTELLDLIRQARGSAEAFEVKVSWVGGGPGLAELDAAGATWCSERIPPGTAAQARAVIAAGPPG
jgi:hypothetical protein